MDVILSDGAAVTGGNVTYVLTYGVDLVAAGYVGYTQSEFGKLVYFDWSPVEWDDPMEHMTVYLHLPVKVPEKEVKNEFLEKIKFRTEKFVNSEYLISYYGSEGSDGLYLTQRLHRQDIASRYHMRIQEYLDASYFPNLGAAARTGGPSREYAKSFPNVCWKA